MKVGVVTVG
jgi:hypothetical protein